MIETIEDLLKNNVYINIILTGAICCFFGLIGAGPALFAYGLDFLKYAIIYVCISVVFHFFKEKSNG